MFIKKEKRERCFNWETEEKRLLREILEPYREIIENKNLSTSTNREKHKAWNEISEKFNEANFRPRRKKQLLNQWKIMKMASKNNETKCRKQRKSSEGGPKPPSNTSDDWDTAEMFPVEVIVDSHEYDDDGEQMNKSEFDFKMESFKDMQQFRRLENDRHQKEHDLRMEIMKAEHEQKMKNLKLHEELLMKATQSYANVE